VISDEYVTFHQEKSYDDDIFYLKKWMNQRLFWLDQQFATVPHSFIPVTRDSYHIFNEDSELKGKLESFQSFDHIGKYKIVSGPKNGKLKLDEISGEFTYLPNTNYYGIDSTFFIYNDGLNNSDSGLLHFEIQPVNDLPVTQNGAFEIKEDESIEKSNTTGLIMYTNDIELDPLTFELVTNVKHGELVLNTNGSFKYTPEKNYFGSDTFYFKAKDLNGTSNVSSIIFKIQPVNDAPVAINRTFSFNEDESFEHLNYTSESYLAEDFDGDSLFFENVSNQIHGQLKWEPSGNFKYTPDLNFYGVDSFNIKAKDTGLNSNIARILLQVNPVNDAPNIVDSIFYFQLNISDQFLFDINSSLYNYVSDIDNSKLDLKILPTKFSNTKGDIFLSNNGVYNYKPNPNANGLDSLKIKVLDLFSSSNEVKVIFRVLNNNQSVNSDNILLFPNPTSSFIRLKNLDVDQIFIHNIYGGIYPNIQFSKVGRDIVINCAILPKGEYTIRLMSKNRYIGTKKFIKL
jgi:hypothetical protein